jgi:hypothetical protein
VAAQPVAPAPLSTAGAVFQDVAELASGVRGRTRVLEQGHMDDGLWWAGSGLESVATWDEIVSGILDESRTPTLADVSDLDSPDIRRVRDTGGRVTLAIHACRKTVIAAINGPAVGIGRP